MSRSKRRRLRTESASKRPTRERPLALRFHSLLRWLHLYLSMISMLLILFFAVTGLTLNHPEWTFGEKDAQSEIHGTFPTAALSGPSVDWVTLDEFLRKTDGVHGSLTDHQATDGAGSLAFRAPGYTADCSFEKTGEFTLTVVRSGFVGAMNDFHRGHDSGKAWPWVIDVCGATLSLIALTGIGLMLYLKRARRTALITLGVACAVVVGLLVSSR